MIYSLAADMVNWLLFDVLKRRQPIISGRTGRVIEDAGQLWKHDPSHTIEQYVVEVAEASGLVTALQPWQEEIVDLAGQGRLSLRYPRRRYLSTESTGRLQNL